MDNAVAVEEVQRAEGTGQRYPQEVQVDRLALRGLLKAAPHQFHDQPAAGADDVVDGEDMRMLERGQQLGLLPVARQLSLVVEKLLMDLLDGDFATQLAVAAAIDGAEISHGDRIDNFVTRARFHHPASFLRSLPSQQNRKLFFQFLVAGGAPGEPLVERSTLPAKHVQHPAIAVDFPSPVMPRIGLLRLPEQDLVTL